MKTDKKLFEEFSDLIKAVRKNHEKMMPVVGGSHDFLHDLMAAQYCLMIAENKRVGRLAFVAAMCHSADRLFTNKWKLVLKEYLNLTSLTASEKHIVFQAVLNHSKPDKNINDPVTITLKDADKLANMGPNVLLRIGQQYSKISPYDIHFLKKANSCSNFKNPSTCLDDVNHVLQWEKGSWLKLKKAKKLSKKWFKFLKLFIKGIEQQVKETGLDKLDILK